MINSLLLRNCIFIFTLCGFISACEKIVGHEYFPLQEGVYWRYKMNYKTMDGRWDTFLAYENYPPLSNDQNTLYVKRTIDGREYHYTVNDEGIMVQNYEIMEGMEKRIESNQHYVFKFPLEVGKTWNDKSFSQVLIKTGPPQKTVFRITANLPVNVTVESMDETVKVPAGEFKDCILISLKGSGFHDAGNYVGHTVVSIDELRWYAPGVGLVKSIRKEKTTDLVVTDGQIILELEEFRS